MQRTQNINYISGLAQAAGNFGQSGQPRNLVLLGSTGSIGRSALNVVGSWPDVACSSEQSENADFFRLARRDVFSRRGLASSGLPPEGKNKQHSQTETRQRFQILALAGGKNIRLLAEQAETWRPPYLAVQDDEARQELLPLLRYQPEVLSGQEGYIRLAALPEADLVLSAQVGAAGLRGTLAAVRAGKRIALANKESLVLAGDLIRTGCRESGAVILPVDSEHNAIFQCLGLQSGMPGQESSGQGIPGQGKLEQKDSGQEPPKGLRRLILTASGGPFRGKSRKFMEQATKREALAHPTWSMGAKITIDSASMMNKGLEIIEASHLFGLPDEQIDVLVHPQSLVHSLVEFEDNSLLAQLGPPDMRVPIAACLGWPGRLQSRSSGLNLLGLPPLTFEAPDSANFPALDLCRAALNGGGGLCVALNAANEVAVILFMADKIGFCAISRLVAAVLEKWDQRTDPQSLEEILDLDEKARRMALELSRGIK